MRPITCPRVRPALGRCASAIRHTSGRISTQLGRGRRAASRSVSFGGEGPGGEQEAPGCLARLLLFILSGFGLRPFMRSLNDAYGWRYSASVVAQYGLNQGAGMNLLLLSIKFYAFSALKIETAEWGRLQGFSAIPWQLKALFGILSDTLAVRGLHRSPYLILGGLLGFTGALMLTVLPASMLPAAGLALLLLLCNLNVAMGDVVVDATIAVKCREVPERAAQLQSLSWGAFGLFGAVAVACGGYMVEYASPRLPFGLSAGCACAVLVPAALGWLERREGSARPWFRCFCPSNTTDILPVDWEQADFRAAENTTCYVDPLSTTELVCGWSKAREYPCLQPSVYSWLGVASMLSIVAGTTLYSSYFVRWRFRTMLASAQLFLALTGIVDLIFVTRLWASWLPDWALILFGDTVFTTIVDRLGDMAFFIFCAKLCPPKVEGSMFALQMGLSNFGSNAGLYLGTAILEIFYPKLHAPEFEGLTSYITLRSALRLLPILLVPFLVPRGRPSDSAKELGAGQAITAEADEEEQGVEEKTDLSHRTSVEAGDEEAAAADDNDDVDDSNAAEQKV
ncbi:hypothetical protein EMIHUDRAFT_416249 [Emiliania huxleyi CCMP1516]|uniref:Biopterin transport-related protein BT1 n=2 Tax=Emiliania huxleyi TaxID=2903 RepID=A0A0D3IVU7_EMIH1|nr:hypothetical protein EMIHUDRAFT_416249 [Emiliania huxleyi CCMP1516]EOD15382.1 hypothetical protein EMIHUDRAFT_416249 [Emiliania huxleyi CCMP1516]|eukprot:XP_005767811.1 hypothetical protein EMIHUDRAFT_416249 [Emiliania huxleyi CCMP1516]